MDSVFQLARRFVEPGESFVKHLHNHPCQHVAAYLVGLVGELWPHHIDDQQ